MVKLRDAKCPNCGANIEVNENLEKSICQYCGGTVIIEEAIEKYKVELTGKVEVEGIKGRSSKIAQARKHLAIGETEQAKVILQELIIEDQFDTEAYIELIKIYVQDIKDREFNENSSESTEPDNWAIVRELVGFYDRIKKIDETNTADSELSDYMEDIKHYQELIEQVNNDEQKLQELLDTLNERLNEVVAVSNECANNWLNQIVGKFFTVLNYETSYSALESYFDNYRMVKFATLSRDGKVEWEYRKITNEYSSNPKVVNLHHRDEQTMESMQEVEDAVIQIDHMTDKYLEESKQIRNKEIDKENKEIDKRNKQIDRENTIQDAKNKFKYVLIGVFALILVILVGWTISLFVKGSIVGAIAAIIFIDSWAVSSCVYKIKDLLLDIQIGKNDIQRNKNNIKFNQDSKKDHV
ncbi:MAG: TFIIB-type zinc ribbon-containing protein [Clostridia bacterium]|nr:TFIIB-type zinc ribbon-containing protein [Clostridia bacterium]